MRRRVEEFPSLMARLYPELHRTMNTCKKKLSKSVTFQVTDACNLACSYCYQTNKGNNVMDFETAKKLIDLLLSGDKGMAKYISPNDSPGISLEFIGGEPLLQIDLIDRIVDYFRNQALMMRHPWAEKYIVGICSNGILYHEAHVKKILLKHRKHLSFSITLDGNKELHDQCRKFPDGSPSYDIAESAISDWLNEGNYMGSKITLAPENISYTFDASKHMVDLGYKDININCVYERGWDMKHAKILYSQLKKFADYLLDNNIDDIYYALFSETYYIPKRANDLDNWCGGNGVMLACDPAGNLFPCLRYMESSLDNKQTPLVIGNVDDGLAQKQCYKDRVACLSCIDRRTQSTDECFNCPIAEGCSWCTAYNYQVFGTPDKRATYICDMHKAASLANVYFWNKYYQKRGEDKHFEMHCPKEWAVPIIGEQEFAMLEELSRV